MRALLLLAAALVCLPGASAIPGVPTVAISLDPSSLSVNASNANQSAVFTGTVSVTKSQYLSATVTLTATVNEGWVATVEPASMTFTTTDPQPYTCKVTVPAATPGGTEAHLIVEGTIQSGLLQNSGEDQAVIQVVGTLPSNQTGNGTGGTKPTTRDNHTQIAPGISSTSVSPGFLGLSNDQWMVLGVVLVVVVAAAGVAVRIRRRKRAAREAGGAETAEEV